MNKPFLPPSRFAPIAQPAPADTPKILSVGDARAQLVARLAGLRVPRFVGSADGADLRAIADHMIEVADAIDAWASAIGDLVQSNSTVSIDPALFERPLFAAIDGLALFEIHRSAEALDEDNGQFGVGA